MRCQVSLRKCRYWSAVAYLLWCGFALAAPTKAKPTGLLLHYPIEIGKSGNIYSQLAVTGEAFAWDVKQKKHFLLSTWPRETHIINSPKYWSTHRLRPRLAVSPDEKMALLQQEPAEYSGERATRLEVVDLADSNFSSFQVLEDSYLEKVPKFSPDSKSFLFSGWKSGSRYVLGMDLVLTEAQKFFSDLQAKSAKSMSEYGQVLYEGKPTSLTEEQKLGEAIWDSAWSPDSQKIVYLLQERDKNDDLVYSIRLFDRATGKHETLFSKESASELYWPTANTIYFVRGTLSGGCQVGSIDVAKKTMQILITGGVQRHSLSVSRDGQYIAYSSDQVSTSPPRIHRVSIYDVSKDETYSVEGTISLRFSSSADSVVASRAVQDPTSPEPPFVVLSVTDLLAQVVNSKISWSNLESAGKKVGKPVLVYDLPADEGQFFSNMSIGTPKFTVSLPYARVDVPILNTSDEYFMVTITKDRMLDCQVLDETGTRISSSMYAPNKPPGQHRMAPGSLSYFASSMYLPKAVAGMKVKFVCQYGDLASSHFEKDFVL
jgi:hypothetical protein